MYEGRNVGRMECMKEGMLSGKIVDEGRSVQKRD
jgi:hypothetical protein